MNTDLVKGIIDGRTLKDWWENTPYGAFANKCAELRIPLSFGNTGEVLGTYEVEISYRYSGRGTAYVTVDAFNEKEAEDLALDKFDGSDIDPYDFEIDDCEVQDMTRKEIKVKPSRESDNA